MQEKDSYDVELTSSKILRKRSLDKYYENPNRCINCDSTINVRKGEKVSDVRRKKFCNNTCSAEYNNEKRCSIRKPLDDKTCAFCKEPFSRRLNESVPVFNKRLFCSKKCSNDSKAYKKSFMVSKRDIFLNSKNWQAARSKIQKWARRLLVESDIEYKCFICGYCNYCEACHIKSVSSFSEDSLLLEINSLSNLIYLCPNHHWEYDNGFLILDL